MKQQQQPDGIQEGSPLHAQLTGQAPVGGIVNEIPKVGELPPKEKTIIVPEGGWKERTYYVVDVAYKSANPVHRAILFVGFIPKDPKYHPLAGGYTCVMSGVYEGTMLPSRAHYINPICDIKELSK